VIGSWILGIFGRKALNGWALLLGLIIYVLLSFIPIIGWLLTLAASLIGFGGILLEKKRYYTVFRSEEVI